jgi:hypothetical protein
MPIQNFRMRNSRHRWLIKQVFDNTFELNVNDEQFFTKAKKLRVLTKFLSQFVHHLESTGTRASWILPAFEALGKDIEVWCTSIDARTNFEAVTIAAVRATFSARYRGEAARSIVGIRAPKYVLAMLLDPTMTVDADALPVGWEQDCTEVLN